VITHLFLPDSCGGAPIFSDLCYGLASRGIDVTVRCAYPYYPEWKDKSGKNGLRIERCEDRGLKIERYGLYIPRNPRSVLERLLYEGSFFLSISRSLFRGPSFDAVLVFCPLAGSVAYAALNKLLHGAPLFLSIMDLPADAASASGMTRGKWLPRLFQWVQRGLFNTADVWRSISPIMIERLETFRRRSQPILFVPDWLHPSIADELGRLPSKVGRPPADPVRLLYSGNVGAKQGLLEFCKLLAACVAPFHFRIHADGGGAAQVRNWVAACGDPRFSFGPLVEESAFVRALHETDLYVITEKPENRAAFFPSKTIPAMASGTPILAVSAPESPLGLEVRTQGLGPWFSWSEAGAVARLLATLPERGEEYAAWQAKAVRRSHYFARERCLDLIESVLNELVAVRKSARSPETNAPERWAALISRTSGNALAPQTLSS
jgi:colanic acid biosynthesis glycosyl transferase WcaI